MNALSEMVIGTSAGAYMGSSLTSGQGTKVLWIIADPPTAISLLDPRQIEPALRSGYERAKTEAPKIKSFWA